MSKHLIKIDNPQHCAISVAHAGLDNQYCESGEVVAIDWQPSSGWGLQEAHYTDDQDQVVQIDLDTREFTMPDYDIVIEGTAKRFVIQDWTTDAPSQSGKVLGIDDNGNIVPTEGLPTYEGSNGDVMQSDGDGGIVANAKVNVTADGDVNAGGNVTADGKVSAGGNISAGKDVEGRNVSARGKVSAEGNVTAGEDILADGNGYFGRKGVATYIFLYDSANPTVQYRISVNNGVLVCSAV